MHVAVEVGTVPGKRKVGLLDIATEPAGSDEDIVHPKRVRSRGQLWYLDEDVVEIQAREVIRRVRWFVRRRRRDPLELADFKQHTGRAEHAARNGHASGYAEVDVAVLVDGELNRANIDV